MILTEIEQAENVIREMNELLQKQTFLREQLKIHTLNKEGKLHQDVQDQLGIIKNRFAILRDSMEYVRLKAFIEVVKANTTLENYKRMWDQTDLILENPIKYLQ